MNPVDLWAATAASLAGGLIGMALIRPERDAMRWGVIPTPAFGSA